MSSNFLGRELTVLSVVVLLLGSAAVASGQEEQVLYNFAKGGTGAYPSSAPTFDKSGNLYVTTPSGGPGAYGTVVELAPPHWSASMIASFRRERHRWHGV
jgi:hypothetical protein